jgi:hypothetical protein
MSFAYHILAFKNAAQVAQLCRVLHHPDDLLVLHVDRRAPRELHALGRDLARIHPNIFVQRARAVVWGGAQISDLQIEAMAWALRLSPRWHHFINLSGQDFPLCSRAGRLARLGGAPATTFLSWFDPVATGRWRDGAERIARLHFHGPWLHRLLRVPGLGRRVRATLGWTNRLPHLPGYRRPPPSFFRYFGGSNHGVFARAACAYLSTDAQARRIRHWLRYAASADEIVFQSALLASALAPTLVNRDWREIDFPPHSPHPRIFRSGDFSRLRASENLFARKFDEAVDSEILHQLEHHLARAPLPSSDARVHSPATP